MTFGLLPPVCVYCALNTASSLVRPIAPDCKQLPRHRLTYLPTSPQPTFRSTVLWQQTIVVLKWLQWGATILK